MYRVGDVTIDVTCRVLRRSDGVEVHLKPKAFAVLLHLLENRGRLVTRQELQDTFWKDTAVTDDALTQCITELRRALADSPRDSRYVKTVPRMGFRFIGEVEEVREGGVVAREEITTVQIREEYTQEPDTVVAVQMAPKRGRGLIAAGLVAAVAAVGGISVWALRLSAISGPPAAASGKKQIAVLRFENRSGQPDLDWLRDGLPDMLTTTLSRSRGLDVLSREQIALWLGHIGDSGRPALQSALEVARRSHAEAAVTGSFVRIGDSIRIDTRIYDGRSGALLGADEITVDKPERILREIDFLSAQLAGHLTPTSVDDRRQLTSLMTENLEAYRCYAEGLAKAEAMHIEDAVQLFQKATALDPGFAMAYARIGYTYAVPGARPAEGMPYLEKAFRMSGKLTEKNRRHIAAWYAIAKEDYPQAIQAYSQLRAEYPGETEAYYRLAMALRGESRHEEAVHALRQALTIDAQDPKLYNSMSVILSEMGGRHEEAVEMAQRYAAMSGGDANAQDTLGLAYQMAGKYAEAVAAFDRSLELKPGFEIAALHRATTLMNMGRERAAMEEFRRRGESAVSARERGRYWEMAAWIYWRRGKTQDASSAIAKVVRYRPGITIWHPALPGVEGPAPHWGGRLRSFYQAQRARETGDAQGELLRLRETLLRRPSLAMPETFEDSLGEALLARGQLDEGIAEYERALKLYPGMGRARYRLAEAYERRGRAQEAKAEYRRFLELWKDADADLPEMVEARKRL